MASWTTLPYDIKLPIVMHFIDKVVNDAARPRPAVDKDGNTLPFDAFLPSRHIKEGALAEVRSLLIIAPEFGPNVLEKLYRKLKLLRSSQLGMEQKLSATKQTYCDYMQHFAIVAFILNDLEQFEELDGREPTEAGLIRGMCFEISRND